MANHATVVQSQEHRAVSRERPPLFRALVAIIVLGLFGLGISGYLTYTHFNEAALVCSVGGCETVQSSSYSTIGPVPIALLGVAMFTAVIGLAGLRLSRSTLLSDETASMLAWGMLLTGILYYVYLTYIELFVLNAICQWCVLSSFAAVGIFGLESVYLYRTVMSDDVIDAV